MTVLNSSLISLKKKTRQKKIGKKNGKKKREKKSGKKIGKKNRRFF
jgi:hypothetical protein